MATSSSFTEGTSVFGGLANLTQAFENIFTIYNPDIVAVHTTCLSEVIGDDIPTIIKKSKEDGKIPKGKYVIHANTPSFVGSHVTGFANMVTAMVKYLSETQHKTQDRINLIPGYVEPADMRELKRLAIAMGVNINMFPDTSDVLDTPLLGEYKMFPKGGATIDQLIESGDAYATIALGHFASHPAATALDEKCNVPCSFLELPIGVVNTDRYIDALRQYASVDVPETLEDERGRLVDLISDMQQYFHQKRIAIFGDPDHVIAMTQFVIELGALPTYILTGSQGNHFERRCQELVKDVNPDAKVRQFGDLFELHQWMKQAPVDLLLGNSYGKLIARAENVPFVRFGWPILDRVGHRIFPTLGYTGAMRLIDLMTMALFDKKERECPEENFELVQ